MALLRMIKPPGYIAGGRVLLGDMDLLTLPDEEMRSARFARISLIPQGAMNSLNPVMRIKHQLMDTISYHNGQVAAGDLQARCAIY
jgi:ABC-type dipeptide/oligopeptide/nickel transport system ATPase component